MNNTLSGISQTRLRFLFYSIMTLLNFAQAWGTELFDDEAYYWMYSKFLDWGYFDHPPVIALLIKMGTLLFPGEFGVRFFIVIIGILTIYLIEYLTKPQDLKLFYAIVLNIAILQIGGMIAVPDIALLFFTALFFIIYQRYDLNSHLKNGFYLSVVVALLLYSKYHGILIILATLISNISLLRRPMTWGVIIFSFILFLPHVLWQANNGYPSIIYQLYGWASSGYRLSFTTEYLLGQLLIFGPFLGWLFIWSALSLKPSNKTEKAMIWSIIGVYTVFFLSSFRRGTEANWTVPLIAPLIYLSYKYLSTDHRKMKWVYRVLPYSMVLTFILRLYMFIDIPANAFMPKDEFHGNRKWVMDVQAKAAGRHVLFTNSYQRPSKYWFYSGDTSFSLNNYGYRQNQYNLWPIESMLQGKQAIVLGAMDTTLANDSMQLPKLKLAIAYIDSFESHSQIMIEQESDLLYSNNNMVNTTLTFSSVSSAEIQRALIKEPELFLIIYQKNKNEPLVINTGKKISNQSGQQFSVNFSIPELNEKQYSIRWGLSNAMIAPTINSRLYTLVSQPVK